MFHSLKAAPNNFIGYFDRPILLTICFEFLALNVVLYSRYTSKVHQSQQIFAGNKRFVSQTLSDGKMPETNWSLLSVFAPFNAADSHLLERTFRVFYEAVEAADVKYFIYGGTLIGSLRHHGRIPWDDDIDVMLNASDKARLFEVLSKSYPEFKVDVPKSGSVSPQWKFYSTNGRIVVNRQYRAPYIDIFFYQENVTHIGCESPYWSETDVWPKESIFPLVRRPFGDLSVLAPCNGMTVIGPRINISVCQSREFDHFLEMSVTRSTIAIPCKLLSHVYPFVRRDLNIVNGTSRLVKETLIHGDWPLNEIVVDEFC